MLKPILIVDDDPIDREMIELAFKRAAVPNPVVTFAGAQSALDYLAADGEHRAGRPCPWPVVIMLDLDMPGIDGFEFLRRVKGVNGLKAVPVVVLTTSQYDGDLARSYSLAASSCLTKPSQFEQLVDIAREVGVYWCTLNRLPAET
jgi:CheY-like chemotaxis protein